jgi:hypothetical protein
MSATAPPDLSVRPILFAHAFGALAGLAALVAVPIVYDSLDGAAFYVVLVCIVVGVIAGDMALERTATGVAQSDVRRRMLATFDLTEDRVYDIARYSPFAVAICCLVFAEPGFAAPALAVTLIVAHLAFAVWLRSRRHVSPAASS